MRQGRRSQDPLIEPFPEPERILRRRHRNRRMENQGIDEMADLRRRFEEMQLANAALQAQVDAVPQNAREYMHPELKVPEPAIVLPTMNAHHFEMKTNFIQLIKASTFEGRPNECPIRHIKLFTDLCDTISMEGVSP